MRRGFALVAAAAALLVLTGCGPYAARSLPLGESEGTVPGTWSHDDGATIVFAEDGTLTYSAVPAELIAGSIGNDSRCAETLELSSDRRDGAGTWTFDDGTVLAVFDPGGAALHAFGFFAFTGLEYWCDVDGVAYRFDRQD